MCCVWQEDRGLFSKAYQSQPLYSACRLTRVIVKWLQMTNWKNKCGELELPCRTPEHDVGYGGTGSALYNLQ